VLAAPAVGRVVDEPAVAIPEVGGSQASARAAGRRAGRVEREHLADERGRDQRAVPDGAVPTLQVGGGGVEAAVSEKRRHGVRHRLLAIGVVAMGVTGPDAGGVGAGVGEQLFDGDGLPPAGAAGQVAATGY
jgi:hypothetical protein